jgi:CRP-like cAMP-binding protein
MTMTQEVKKGDVIFREGNFSDTAYIIESGSFQVTKHVDEGGQKVISILQKNDIFGEMGIIDGLPRSATVTALENGKVTVVTKEDFESLARRNPNALMPILKILSMRLRKALKREARAASLQTEH